MQRHGMALIDLGLAVDTLILKILLRPYLRDRELIIRRDNVGV